MSNKKKLRPDTYTCHECGVRHTTENMVAYCAVCFDKAEGTPSPEAEAAEKVVEAARPFASKGCTSDDKWVTLHDAMARLAAIRASYKRTERGTGHDIR